MKIINLFISCVFISIIGIGIAQENPKKEKKSKITTATFSVNGVCGMCEKRIEDAALIKGVKLVEWDKLSQSLKVIFNNTKTSEEAIAQSVADAGHDTENVKSTDEIYKTLPGCCAYRDGVKVH